ncbi:M67 family metallopeptidase [Nitriliruptoraceae bacterium ZYF776]|nr:M67 family metallopeptidase [Profundirhabdus halotolerans]
MPVAKSRTSGSSATGGLLVSSVWGVGDVPEAACHRPGAYPRFGYRPAAGRMRGTAVGREVFPIDRATWDQLVEHSWSDFPYEVCGLLGIRPDGGAAHFPIPNAERSMTYYVMEPKPLLRAMREIEDEGWGLAIYHSHTHTQAYPSATDIRLAAYPEATYLIVTLQDRDHPDIRAFSIVDGEVTEKDVVLREPAV